MNWQRYIEIAELMSRKAKWQDREDVKHDIIIRLCQRELKHGEIRSAFLMRAIAQESINDYYRILYRREKWEAVGLTIEDDEGNKVSLIDTLASDQSSTEDWVIARDELRALPTRVIKLGAKKIAGIALTSAEHKYLQRFRLGAQVLGEKQLRLPL